MAGRPTLREKAVAVSKALQRGPRLHITHGQAEHIRNNVINNRKERAMTIEEANIAQVQANTEAIKADTELKKAHARLLNAQADELERNASAKQATV